jgi:hypothetical protein
MAKRKAKKSKGQKPKGQNLYMLAIVSIVAIVGIVVLILNAGSSGVVLSDYDLAGEAVKAKAADYKGEGLIILAYDTKSGQTEVIAEADGNSAFEIGEAMHAFRKYIGDMPSGETTVESVTFVPSETDSSGGDSAPDGGSDGGEEEEEDNNEDDDKGDGSEGGEEGGEEGGSGDGGEGS